MDNLCAVQLFDESGATKNSSIKFSYLIGTNLHKIFVTEFSLLTRYYNLLYQSLIPNCCLTLNTVQRYYDISQSEQKLILTGPTVKIRVQYLLNFLMKSLNADKDHVKFCNVISAITVMGDLPHKLTEGTYTDIITVK